MNIDLTKILFDSGNNLMKIYANDSTSISIADTFNAGTFQYDSVDKLVYTHNLGSIPRARVFYEPVSGQLWPMTGDEQFSKSNGGTGTTLTIFGTYYLTTTGLYVRIKNETGSTQNVNFYYRIYTDE